ncbi:MurR/RpiR family transcriptional regulator [Clostridium transplantifaecale]|uniref:MurR/RpiR family transcriptional regulator n=1 Tax=Clostridium transplantifaecale TaxID=2479838 RepID=UPI000F6348C6|nr:MurR/RpiR family transcriptional regulator [Clostridium transplantifaecale]
MDEAKSVIGVICSSYDSFFDSEKKIANCIMERRREVVDMTVAELAQASGASDASVSRFCRRCGFKGFHQLKMTLAGELAEESRGTVGNDISRRDIGQSLQNILANKTEELKQTVAMMEPENLDRILDVIQKAGTVQFVAVGNTIPVAMDAVFKFNQLGIPAVTGTILETQTAYAFNLGKKDVIIAISNSGVSRRLIRLLEGASGNGVTIISITNSPDSPVAKLSNYHITTATREKLLREDFLFSRVPATMVIEILYLLLSVSIRGATESVRRHETAIMEDKQIR